LAPWLMFFKLRVTSLRRDLALRYEWVREDWREGMDI